MFAADAADIGHVPPVSTNCQSAFPGNFALLLCAHGGKTAAAFLLPSLGVRTGTTPGGSGTVGASTRLSALGGSAALG